MISDKTRDYLEEMNIAPLEVYIYLYNGKAWMVPKSRKLRAVEIKHEPNEPVRFPEGYELQPGFLKND